MKKFSTLLLLLLTSCATLHKDAAEIKAISHDAIDEGVDKADYRFNHMDTQVNP